MTESNEGVLGGNGNIASDLINSMRSKAPKTAMAIAAAQVAWPLIRNAKNKLESGKAYTIKVPDTDEIYDDLQEWVLSLMPTDHQHSLTAYTGKADMIGLQVRSAGSGSPAPLPRVRLRYDGTRQQTVRLGDHDVKVLVNESEGYGKDGVAKPGEIIFYMTSLAAQRHLLTEIDGVIARSRDVKRTPRFRMLSKWGDWLGLDELPPRDLDSVILPDGQLERLIADVGGFLDAEQDYLRRCVPWHRGHLYEGPPGTGKTSVARAVASHFGMDIWYLPLADLDKDGGLMGAISRITPRSMLLLEDVDVFHAATARDDEDGGVTLSGLLNALDGIATPHGLMTVLTTNTLQALDPALIRPGRVDMVEHFGNADSDQVRRILERWYDVELPGEHFIGGTSPAEIVETCKRHANLADAMSALEAANR